MTPSAGLVPSFRALSLGRAAAAAALAAAIAAIASAAALAEASMTRSVGGPVLLLASVVGVVIVAVDAWVLSVRQPWAAIGASVVALTATAGIAAHLGSLPDRSQVLLLSVGPMAMAGAAAVGTGWRPSGRSAGLVWGLSTAGAIVLALGFDPLREPACAGGCADAPALLAPVMSTRAALWVAVTLMVAALCAYAYAVVRSDQRSAPMVVLVGVGACMGAVVVAAGIRVIAWQSGSTVSLLVAPSGAIALGVGTAVALAAGARTRRDAERLLAGLASQGADAPAGVQFAVPGEDRWVDPEGRPATGTGFIFIGGADQPVARVPRAAAGEWASGGEPFGPAALLALRNAQLRAVARSRVEELRTSRRRIVEVADEEGRQLERDLHDGAQQRLVGAALHLAVARRSESDVTQLAAADRSMREALGQLREIAHGIAPEVLRAEGVWAAIADLTASIDLTVTLRTLPETRPGDLAAETALFRSVALCLDLAASIPAVRTRVEGWARDGVIGAGVDVTGGGIDPEMLMDASDRIGALGGTVAVVATPAGCRVAMEVPCAS